MIKIYAQRHGGSCEIKLRGHAMYSKGADIVCAAVSTLYYSLLAAAEKDESTLNLISKEKSGSAYLRFMGGEKLIGAYEMAIAGFKQICAEYPKNVKLLKAKEEMKYE